jgi:hypothetical protein
MYWSEPLPPANWKKPKRKGGIPASLQREIDNSRLRIALEQIANGDNDARSTARQALGWK